MKSVKKKDKEMQKEISGMLTIAIRGTLQSQGKLDMST